MDILIEGTPLWEIITIVVCLILSAFFSSVETALTSITPAKTMQIMDSKSSGAKYLNYWFLNPGKILTTILIGNNLVNILATALTTVIAKRIFDHNVVAIAVGVMTFLILTFGEIFPKIFAKANATKLGPLFIRFLMFFYYIFYPITTVFVFISERIFKSTSLQYLRRGPLITLKDLDFFISLAEREGSLTGTKGMYLKAVSEFSELKVKNIMLPQNKVTTININIDIPELIKIIKSDMYTRYPVVNNKGTFIGILHAKDLLLNIDKCEEENSIAPILRPVVWTNEFMKIDYVLEMMKIKKSQLFLVKDEYNQFCGIITMEDILEELVGEIEDEHDFEETTTIDISPNTFIIDGEESLHDLNLRYNFKIPEDKDFQTLNGFLLEMFNGVVPNEGTIIMWEDLKIKILKNKDKNVSKAEITLV